MGLFATHKSIIYYHTRFSCMPSGQQFGRPRGRAEAWKRRLAGALETSVSAGMRGPEAQRGGLIGVAPRGCVELPRAGETTHEPLASLNEATMLLSGKPAAAMRNPSSGVVGENDANDRCSPGSRGLVTRARAVGVTEKRGPIADPSDQVESYRGRYEQKEDH